MRARPTRLALTAALALGLCGGLAACERPTDADKNPANVATTAQDPSAVDESQVKGAAKDVAREVAAGATAVVEGVKEGAAEGHSEAKQELRENEAASAAVPKA